MDKEINHSPRTVTDCITGLRQVAPGTIGDLLDFRVLEEDPEVGTCTLTCVTQKWMRNSFGTLHGGMCATILDQAMGFLARSQMPGDGISPTIQMQVNYHKPLIPEREIIVRMRMVSKTKNLITMVAEAAHKDEPERICLSANATSFFKYPKK